MASLKTLRLFTLVQREIQEYKLSLVWTPIAIAAVLSILMLGSVLLANRISVMGDTVLDVILADKSDVHPVITINIDDDRVDVTETTEVIDLIGPEEPDYQVTRSQVEDPNAEEDWNFSREWRFEPEKRDEGEWESQEVGSLNPVLNVIHGFLLVILVLLTVNYLLGCNYNDRKDRSILFWKSMPVSEWEEVLARFGVALVVAPAVYIAVSLITQIVFVLLAMLMVWRMDHDPFVAILGNIEFGSLLAGQLGGWIMTALWVAPAYAYLLLASSWAKRSPFLTAIAPVVALMLVEGLILGTDHVLSAIVNHVPHYIGGESAVGFYFDGQYWNQFDFVSLFAGLVFAAAAIVGSVYLRRYRFEI